MTLKILLVVFGGLALFGLASRLSQNQNAEWEKQHSLETAVQRTKDEGKSKVVIPGPRIEYGGVNMTLPEALRLYSVFIAEPLESKTYVSDSDHIVTWYRFVIRETLSLRAPLVCDTCPKPGEAPVDMLPVKPGELLISKVGGTTTLNGVQVTMTDLDLRDFDIGKKYLMFVSVTPTGVAMIGGGPAGIFQITEGDRLEALTKKNLSLDAELRNRFDLNLSGFRAFAKP
jgi:hypothetical protein